MTYFVETPTLGDLLLRAAGQHPDRDAIVFPDQRLTYSELAARAEIRARSLIGLGVEPGEHVGILMPNCIDFLEVLFGAALAGAVPVPINARYKAAELGYVIDNADLRVLVTTDVIAEYVDYVALLTEAFPSLRLASDPMDLHLGGASCLRQIVLVGSACGPGMMTGEEFAAAARGVGSEVVDSRRTAVRLRDPAVMIYTSGTTAHPKGCPLSHESLVRNGMAMGRTRYLLEPGDSFWDPLPMFHMSALLPLTAVVDAGAQFVSMTHFEVDGALEQIIAERPTVLYPSFPTITSALIEHTDWPKVDLSRIRVVNNVAPPDMLRRFQGAYPDAIQVSAYGLSEAGGVVSFNELTDDIDARTTSCGRPFQGIDVRIVDPETLEDVAPGERGEILISGYSLFEGYYKDPEKTEESMVDGTWLRTGDLCSLDSEGRISYHGRLKDMLKVGGENVAAVEIESFLATHPAVQVVQVVGVPDDRLQEVPLAFVELKSNSSASPEELIDFCRGKIASFKVPREIRFVSEWPMSATKIQKYILREMAIGD